jgi:hypothetical protein
MDCRDLVRRLGLHRPASRAAVPPSRKIRLPDRTTALKLSPHVTESRNRTEADVRREPAPMSGSGGKRTFVEREQLVIPRAQQPMALPPLVGKADTSWNRVQRLSVPEVAGVSDAETWMT